MSIKVNFDSAHNPETPTLILARKNGDKLGMIKAVAINVKDALNDACEITFNVYKYENGDECPLWEQIVDFKLVYCVEWNMWFEITVEIDESSEVMKTVYCTQLGHAELSQINLYNIQINTEDDIAREEYELPTILYYPEHPEASLLHRITEKAPHYSISHVDDTIAKIQRTFEFDDTSIYDALQDIADEIHCLFVLDSKSDENGNILRTISAYDLESTCNNKDCGYRGEFIGACPECGGKDIDTGYGKDTGVFITADEVAEAIQLSTNTEQIKNCFKLEAGDDMMNATIRNCNPNGSDYVWYISDAMKSDMSDVLVDSIESYDEKYVYYYKNKNYTPMLNIDSIEKYNEIIKKYGDQLKGYLVGDSELASTVLKTSDGYFLVDSDGKSLITNEFSEFLVPPDIIGYPSVMKLYYNAIDVKIFLQSAMMPNAKLSDTTAKIEADKLTAENLSPVAAADEKTLKNMSEYTAGNIVLSVAKVLADSRYKIKVNTSSFNKGTKIWTGNFIVTNYSDDEDTATSEVINVQVNADYEKFVKQKLDKALDKTDTDDMSISGLFKKDISKDDSGNIVGAFVEELKKYSLNRLTSFHDACQSCIDILVEQGVADKETWSTDTNESDRKNLYDDLYQPYLLRLQAIENEMNIRKADIEAIAGIYEQEENGEKNENGLPDSYDKNKNPGKLVVPGFLNYLEELIETVQKELDFQAYIEKSGKQYWIEFCSFRREDKYSNDNYVSDGLGNSDIIRKANEFIKTAKSEIYKSSERQTAISSDLYNLLAIDRFKPFADEFKVGNWIRVRIDEKVYRLRLVEYEIDYDDLESIPVEFADAVNVNSSIKSVKDVLEQASSMATSYDSVKRQAKQGEKSNAVVSTWIEDGLNATNTKIVGGSDNQTQTWDNHGMLFRKFDIATNDYEPTQMKIINSTMAITSDNWKTTKTAIGEYYYFDPKTSQLQKAYGVNAETIVGRLVLGESLFFTNSSGNLSFDEKGLMATSKDNKKRVIINPNDDLSVFKIQHNSTGQEGDFTNVLTFSEDGDLLITGNIVAKSLTLVERGSDSGEYEVNGFAEVALSGDYNHLTNKPVLAKIATTGSYADLLNAPNFDSKLDIPENDTASEDGSYLCKQGGKNIWKLADTNVSQNSTVPICGKAVYDYAIPKKFDISNAKKLLYIDDTGNVTSISIGYLKTLLGM